MSDIGVVGLGIVGTAVREGMKHAFGVEVFDKYKESTVGSVAELFTKVDGPLFVCVPTPMRKNGSCDAGIVESVVAEVNDYVEKTIGEPAEHAPLVIKSTVPPGTTQGFNDKYKFVRV